MNQTRKKIIELIEPYMNKELSEGCRVKYFLTIENSYWIDVEFRKYQNWEDLGKYVRYEILWHYDITAVLKYVRNKTDYCIWFPVGSDEYINYFILNKVKFSIPNKPLHLYTEQEDKDLLKLLLKLWTENN